MAKPRLVLSIDIVSPFAYIAFHVVRTSIVFRKCELIYIPVLLGGIMKACGNPAPIYIKNKREWTGTERRRWARLFNVPMAEEGPPGFPPSTVQVQRALCAVSVLHPEKLGDIIAALYHALFVQHHVVSTPEGMKPIFNRFLGEDETNEILVKTTSDEIKKFLTANTDAAFAEGSFGLPWFAATNARGEKECYWGFDHIGQVAAHLGLERPAAGILEGGWRAML